MVVLVAGAAVTGTTVVGTAVVGTAVVVVGSTVVSEELAPAVSGEVVVVASVVVTVNEVVVGSVAGTMRSGGEAAPSATSVVVVDGATVEGVVEEDAVAWEPSSVRTAETWSSSSPGRNQSMPTKRAPTAAIRSSSEPLATPGVSEVGEPVFSIRTPPDVRESARLAGSRIRESRRHS